MSNRIIKTKASPAFVSNLEVDNLVVNQSLNEDSTVIAVDEDYSVTTLGPSIIAADTTGGEIDINLPPLSENIGRKLYVINIGAANNINVNAGGSDTIGATAQSTIAVLPAVTTTILIGTDGYWEQVATGGGGGGSTTYDVITGIYDTGWVSNNSWSNTEFIINHNFNKPLSNLIVKFYYSLDGLDSSTIQVDLQFTHDDGIGADGGQMAFGIDDNSFKIQTGASGIYVMTDGGLQNRIFGTTTGFYRVVVYDPNKIAAASSVEKYSTGWFLQPDLTNVSIPIIHGLDSHLSDLIVRVFISSDGTDGNAREVLDTIHYGNPVAGNSYGLELRESSTSQITLNTGSSGISVLNTANGDVQGLTSSQYLKVVVYKPTFLERNLEVVKYDTGWINRTDWTNVAINIPHNLGAELPELISHFYISSDGTDANAIEVKDNIRSDVDDQSGNTYFGFQYESVDSNSFEVHTGSNGIVYINGSGQYSSLEASTSYYYRVIAYKPKIMEAASPVAVSAKSNDYTIASRNDSRIISVNTNGSPKTVTLPDSTISQLIPGDEFEVIKENNGDGLVTFATQGTDTIEGLSYVTLNLQYDRARVRYIRNGWFQLIEHRKNGFDALADGVGTYVGMGKYDTGWMGPYTDWTNAEYTIQHNFGKPLSQLVVTAYMSTNGSDSDAVELSTAQSYSSGGTDYGHSLVAIDNNSFKFHTATIALMRVIDTGGIELVDTESRYLRVVVYDPERISAAPSVQKYSTGWVSLASWGNAEVTITHGLDTPMSDLMVEFFVSSDGTEANARRLDLQFRGSVSGTSSNDFFGFTYFAINDNSFKFQTAQDGVPLIQDNGTFSTVGAGWYYKFNVYKPTFIARELEVTKYDTGWVGPRTDWTNEELTVNHNLGSYLPELIVKFFVSDNGTDANAVEPVIAARTDIDAATVDNHWGHQYQESTLNSFIIQTGEDGILLLRDDGTLFGLDTESYYWRCVVYKPALLEKASPVEVRAVSSDYTIQGRNDSRHISVTTGPNAINIQCNTSNFMIGDRIRISKADAGTGTVAFVGTNVEGYSSGIYLHSQYNYMELEWNGVDFTLNNYKDNGSNADGEWTRKADGTQTCRRRISLGTVSITSAYGNLFIDDSDSYGPYTYPIAFASGTIPAVNFTAESSGIVFWTVSGTSNVGTDTATPNVRMVKGTSGNVTNTVISYIAEGRWRP